MLFQNYHINCHIKLGILLSSDIMLMLVGDKNRIKKIERLIAMKRNKINIHLTKW